MCHADDAMVVGLCSKIFLYVPSLVPAPSRPRLRTRTPTAIAIVGVGSYNIQAAVDVVVFVNIHIAEMVS